MERLTLRNRLNWPLANDLGQPIYAEFDRKVYQQFQKQILRGDYDLVHAFTPMMPRYPVKAVKACRQTPFLLGPVNGGVPFPPGFQEVARQEFSYLNFLRAVGRALVPGQVETYNKADKILAGSTYTLNLVKEFFSVSDQRIELFYENGISQDFLESAKAAKKEGDQINLVFVGRLVPYKCLDILLESIRKLDPAIQSKIRLTIVGDCSEKNSLGNRVKELNFGEIVSFAGWVNQQ